ncbi:MAG: GtrA family protein [Rhodanobacteraceae bacterium]|nr:GtrA family protein [Rhodanobacteraceae bacterium]HPF73514.1 GtrA family protein [Xanthomonadaceae bacterium]
MALADRLPSRQLVLFSISGGLAFLVDAGVTHLLIHQFGVEPFRARIPAIALAVLFTWLFNRYISFRHRRSRNRLAEFGRYLLGNAFGLAANYGAYALVIATVAFTREWPIFAVAAGSIAGFLINYASAHHFVFRERD